MAIKAVAQPGDKRIQYSGALKNAFFGTNIGYINYRFTNANLEPGYTAEAIQIPHPAVRMVLYGRHINKHLAAQITYMRPVSWVQYKNINGSSGSHSVWMNIAGLSLLGNWPLNKKLSLSTEAGFGIITRKGFSINAVPIMKSATYSSLLTGGAFHYHINSKWDLQVSTVWSPKNKGEKQPATTFIGAGFNYRLRPLLPQRVEEVKKANNYFPKHTVQVAYITNALGYGVNNAVSKGPIPIFWGGEAHISKGFSLSYQRNIFHTKKVFAMDWAAAFGWWQSRENADKFITFSLSPVLHFTGWRSARADLFFEYSVAGPTYISKTIIDKKQTGKHFTFYDFMGMGVVAGKKKNIIGNIRIAHFSNGNIYPSNDGLKIPLSFCLGYNFPY
jgi:Lipid A 3-O-deacylase (PagL)